MRCVLKTIVAVTLGVCALRPLAAQASLPACDDTTGVASSSGQTRTSSALITLRRSGTGACRSPSPMPLLVRVGATDTVTVQPGGTLVVPIIAGPGLAAMQMTLDYASTRVTLDSLRSVAPWVATLNPVTRAWNAFSPYEATSSQTAAHAFFSVKARTGRTDVRLLGPFVAVNATGEAAQSRLIVRSLIVCVASC